MDPGGPLAGISITELAGGVGGAWCTRLLADLGATVRRVVSESGDPLVTQREIGDASETEGLVAAWLNAGKHEAGFGQIEALVEASDIVVIGEAAERLQLASSPRLASVDLSWFGRAGPYAGWAGTDLLAHALCGMIYPSGDVEGPPQQLGDGQAAMIGGVTAAFAALTAVFGGGAHRHIEVSILEACMVLGELQTADEPTLGRPTPRVGVNRFSPTCPVGIHACREGWLGVTIITPMQWTAFCELLDMQDEAADPGLATIHDRINRAAEIEAVIDDRLKSRTAQEWAALGRERRIPLVVVPDADGILEHPIFAERGSLKPVDIDGRTLLAPASPLRVSSPHRVSSQVDNAAAAEHAVGDVRAPLAGLRIADFSMGWAGPLATRMLADLGAEVIKIEAGRYPDWWRATDWSPDAIARRQFEESRRFAALNRGKASFSADLTTEEGRSLVRRLVATCDAAIENHAAGVIDRLGVGWSALSEGRDDLVMVSMSAFGTGNGWSDTRAYGSTLEQASGVPSFRGRPDAPPTLGHIAYGDPVGGLYGATAMMAALVHAKRTGLGQWLNLSQVECLLPFNGGALLARQAVGRAPERQFNRHAKMVPHGIYPADGEDAWIAIAVDGTMAWRALVAAMDHADWQDGSLDEHQVRLRRQDEIDAAIAAWTATRPADALAHELQAEGVAAAPVLQPSQTHADKHLLARRAFHDTERDGIGHQRQAALPLLINGERPTLRGIAPFLGHDTATILSTALGMDRASYEALLTAGVVSLRPTQLRGAAATGRPDAAKTSSAQPLATASAPEH
ncbi:CoA transferase [Acuticoccus sp.]|uniref:CaiB/BaiF CoA-transferase family protein n=1 Tax=Acuticoccus sp. TaxID=1904378 RepID=UPI003B524ACE